MTDVTEIKTLKATKSWGRGKVYADITETIGHTPLVRVARMAKNAGASVSGHRLAVREVETTAAGK